MKTYTLDEMKDDFIGKIGTPEQARFEGGIAGLPYR